MKKLCTTVSLIGIGIISSLFCVFANQSVFISAVVGAINHAPVILSISPSSDPKLLGRNKLQNYTLFFRDDEKENITYTITPLAGYSNPISGNLVSGDYDSQSGAYINFTYLSPSDIPTPNPTTVTITLNDGVNLVNKDIRLFIY